MGRRNSLLPVFLTCYLILAFEAHANDWPACEDDNPDVSIVGCTKIIKAGKQSTKSIAGAHFIRGNSYLNKGDNKRAIADYNKAIKLNSRDADFYSNRGVAYFNSLDFERAIADATQSISLKPEKPGAYYNRGTAYLRKGNRDRAIEDFNKAIELNPEDADVYFNRGYTYFLESENDKAIADFRKAIELRPEHPEAKSYLLMLGQ